MSHAEQAPIAVIVLTFNEERNLPQCLESIAGWAAQLFIVDSGSTDGTAAVAARFGAELVVHPFETHARQWTWALQTLPISTRWVLALDADQSVTPQLRDDISRRILGWSGSDPAGAYVNRRQVFRGRWIKHGGYYPKRLLKLFRRDAVRVDETDLVDHHFRVSGDTVILNGDLIEDNRNEQDIVVWIDKHNRYAVAQALEEHRLSVQPTPAAVQARLFGTPDERVAWQKRLWNRLPLYIRPFGYFGYRYIVRLGFLDGKEGFIFHFLQAFWYRLLVDINRDEFRRRQADSKLPAGEVPVKVLR